MKRLMKQLGELSGDTCDKLLLPLGTHPYITLSHLVKEGGRVCVNYFLLLLRHT